MKNLYQTIISCLLAIILAGSFSLYVKAGSSFNQQINYEGKLTDSSGVAVADGYYCMNFAIYDALTDGNLLWSEEWKTDNDHKVHIVSGLFSVLLGSQTSISSLNFDSASLYLEIQLDSTCNNSYEEIFSPRKRLGAVPASFEAKQLGGKTWEVPGTIGSTTPNSGAFTNLSVSSTATFGYIGINNDTFDAKLVVDNGTVSTGGFDYTNWFKSGVEYTDIALGSGYFGALGYAESTDDDNEVAQSAGIAGISNGIGSKGVLGLGHGEGTGGMFGATEGGVGLLTINLDPSSYAFVSYQGANLLLGQTAMGGNEDVVQLVVAGTEGQTANLQEWRDSEGGVLASIDATGKLTAVGGIDPPYMLFDLQTREEISGKLSQGIPSDKKGGAMVFFNSNTKRLEYYVQTEGLFYDLQGNIINESGAIGSGEVSSLKTQSFISNLKESLFEIGIFVENGVATLKGIVTDNITAKTARLDKLEMVDSATGDIYCTWIENGEWQKIKSECSKNVVSNIVQETVPVVDSSAESIEEILDDLQMSIENQTTEPMIDQQPITEGVVNLLNEPEQIENPLSGVADLIENATSSLLNGVWNFLKMIISAPFEKISSLLIVQKIKFNLLNSVNFFQAGLLSSLQKTFDNINSK